MEMNLKEKAKDLFDATKEPAAEIACSLFLDGIVGTVAPGVVSSMLAYKQKRQERMFEEFMLQIKNRILVLEERLTKLEPDEFIKFKEYYFGIISDYALDEVQEEKIQYIANGFINIAGMKNPSEDFILTYYDTLKELRMVDIGVLKFYYERNAVDRERTYIDILNEFQIDYDQYKAVRERLLRLGLFTSKRAEKEDDLYKNILLLQDIIRKSMKGEKINSISFKRLDRSDSMMVSKFGRSFIQFFMNEI